VIQGRGPGGIRSFGERNKAKATGGALQPWDKRDGKKWTRGAIKHGGWGGGRSLYGGLINGQGGTKTVFVIRTMGTHR